jgi:UDP-4-amino-4,6-dideoxy-N-acetyl-beta-L-altrosamine transaminase
MSEPDFLPYGRQSIDDADIEALVEAARADFLTTGPGVARFEEAFAEIVGAEHAVAVSNGTAALHCAVHAIGIESGDEVVVPAVTFLASANCVRYAGGSVRFADVDPESGLVRAEDLERALTDRTRAVIVVHLNGRAVDLDAIHALAHARGLAVIEDAAHALGGAHGERPVGGDSRTRATTFSFHPVKHVTTGEGGAITTPDAELAHRLRRFRNHGIERDPDRLERPSPGPWYYEQQVLGFNYRITDLQCALGLSQLSRLGSFVDRRRALAARYDERLSTVPHVRPVARGRETTRSAFHLYAVLVDFDALGLTRAAFMDALRQRGIGTQVHYEPIPTHPDWIRNGATMDELEGAAAYASRVLSLPMFPRMADADVDRVVDAIRAIVELRRSAGA